MARERTEQAKATVIIREEEEEERRGEIWAMHYSSFHQILLVGDGDFSFSLSLAHSFGSASNIVASSLDPFEFVIKKYKNAKSNLEILKSLGASVLHGVDATKMKLHTDLKMRKFDRIIFNFPHAGFHGKEDNINIIRRHRKLVEGFFRSASGMLRPEGEIHVNHKITAPFCDWNLEELASKSCLAMIECVDFKIQDYPGYSNKRGAGSRCDEPFPLGECSTFKFRFSSTIKKKNKSNCDLDPARKRSYQCQEIPIPLSSNRDSLEGYRDFFDGFFGITHPIQGTQPVQICSQPITSSWTPSVTMNGNTGGGYFGRTHLIQEIPIQIGSQPITSSWTPSVTMNGNTGDSCRGLPYVVDSRVECSRIFGGYLSYVEETFGRTDYNVHCSVQEALRVGFARYMAENPQRTSEGYIAILQELHRLSGLRLARLQRMLRDPNSQI